MRRIIALAGMLMAPAAAFAGAWTQAEGQLQSIITSTYYHSGQRYDTRGHKQPQATYTQQEISPYAEYGWRDGTTLGTRLSLMRATQAAQGTSRAQVNWGFGDSEFFVRRRLWRKDDLVLSAEPLVKLPSPGSSGFDAPRLGGSHADLAMGLAGGYGFAAFGRSHFTEASAQYRARLGSAKNQWRFTASGGARISSRLMLMPQLFIIRREESPAAARFTQSAGDDFNQLRLQLSAVYELSPAHSVQLGAFTDRDGKNTGAGHGVLLALWTRW